MKYRQTFTVEGSHTFPWDMLRYDRCFPESPDDSFNMADASGRRRVTFGRYIDRKDRLPTVGRWMSFGWYVDERTIETVKV